MMDTVFFPRKDYDVEVCAHRLGKSMTYTEQTDGLQLNTSYAQFMALAKARYIKTGCFVYIPDFQNANIQQALNDSMNGHIWLDLYSLCPSLSEKIVAGIAITEEEWDAAYDTELLPAFSGALHRKPVALSYSYGRDSFKDYITQLLGARNSAYNGDTDYGFGHGSPADQPYSFARYKSKASTIRWYDYAKDHGDDFSGTLSIVGAKIDETKANGGWMNNFTHWHHYWQQGNQVWAERYLDLLAGKNANNDICFTGYGEALAYLLFRQSITRAVMYSPTYYRESRLVIRLETDLQDADPDLMQVPVSVKFSTVGTPLAGVSIRSDNNLVSLGGGDYIVEIPFARFPGAVIEKL